ncbi:AGAP009825-PA [Anopheles gambiae str. PEST]|uniref:AGAP009825-PA n=1 Tax=Anopheles gambiae TaxID=7165 RepID=Q7Q1E8_ANOGA|nr:AGAP009825-PA [Anopheles gambiae str. PEST]
MSDLKQCPFEVTHLIEGKSFAMHIVKCQRQHPDIKLARCHLDTSHLMREEELQQHMKTCTSRGQLDAYKYSLTTGAASRVSSLPDPADDLIINTTEPIIRRGGGAGGGGGRGRGGGRGGTTSTTVGQTLLDDTECWDDSDCKAYDPLESCRAKKNENAAFITPKINQFVEQRTAAAVLKNDSGTKREPTSDEEFGSSALNERQNDLEQFGLRRNASHGANAGRVVSGRYGEIKQEPAGMKRVNGTRTVDDRIAVGITIESGTDTIVVAMDIRAETGTTVGTVGMGMIRNLGALEDTVEMTMMVPATGDMATIGTNRTEVAPIDRTERVIPPNEVVTILRNIQTTNVTINFNEKSELK